MDRLQMARLAINGLLNMDEERCRRLYRLIPIFIMGVICFPVYYCYLSIACENPQLKPYIHKYCPAQKFNFLSYLPLENITKNTASVAEALSDFDVASPWYCVAAKSASIEIRSEIIHSDIDPEVKTKLVDVMSSLEKDMNQGADQATYMTASFAKILYTLPMHTEFLLDDLSKLKNSNNYQSQQLQIESSNIKTTALATDVFNDYIITVNKHIDEALLITQSFSYTLESIHQKIEIAHDLAARGKKIHNLELDQLLKDSFWSWIFGKDIINIKKHQRNIKTLDDFGKFITKLSRHVDILILQLKTYKIEATNIKQAAADLLTLERKSPEQQLTIIKATINRLAQVKQAFERKINEEDPKKYLN